MARAQDERIAAAEGRGCLGKAHPDEPVFILRAQDRFAPGLVEEWARQVDRHTQATLRGTGSVDNTRAKIKEARALAHEMRAWQEKNSSKTPD